MKKNFFYIVAFILYLLFVFYLSLVKSEKIYDSNYYRLILDKVVNEFVEKLRNSIGYYDAFGGKRSITKGRRK
ncbi:hypothetical protein [Capnocytophaga cynodegmi]|uniref:Uncharacterized protein n=1 Tax=Capnocytophaga cynodegmi TaxID=28189 RepID=A0A0B7HFZ7_9FLAO|nr:hypothetical protein [Capnocytophaga cynodegmi]CEN37604.1 hypothetical protein CCYN2B_40149 [Capnocytophaga cynodegmi]